jgi:hypothetical protein
MWWWGGAIAPALITQHLRGGFSQWSPESPWASLAVALAVLLLIGGCLRRLLRWVDQKSEEPTAEEMNRWRTILNSLRTAYRQSGGPRNLDIHDGLEPLPKGWVEKELKCLGETRRQAGPTRTPTVYSAQ